MQYDRLSDLPPGTRLVFEKGYVAEIKRPLTHSRYGGGKVEGRLYRCEKLSLTRIGILDLERNDLAKNNMWGHPHNALTKNIIGYILPSEFCGINSRIRKPGKNYEDI
jgi:hypothetical protein